MSVHSVGVALTLYYPLVATWSDEAKSVYFIAYARIVKHASPERRAEEFFAHGVQTAACVAAFARTGYYRDGNACPLSTSFSD